MQSILQRRRIQQDIRHRIQVGKLFCERGEGLSTHGPRDSEDVEKASQTDEHRPNLSAIHNSDTEESLERSVTENLSTSEPDFHKDKTKLIDWDGPEDPNNPKNWSSMRKWQTMSIVGTTGLLVGWASSIDSAVSRQAAAEFHVSAVTEALATGLFLIAFGFGSLIAAPFSESVGRNPVYVASLLLFMVFIMASGLSPNIGAQLAFRLLAGFFGCTPLTTFGGSMSDMFHPLQRTYVFPICACLSFLGPFLAPMVGAFIGQSHAISWRWTEWTTLIMAALITSAIALFVPETYAPILLKWKAEAVRSATGDKSFLAQIEVEQLSLAKRLLRSAGRPFNMFFREIMVTLFTVYLSIVYIILFGFLVGYDYIFGEVHHLSQGNEGLCFIGMNVGFLIALGIVPGIYWHYRRKLQQARISGRELEAEQRLWFAMLGAPWLPISLFWLGWTAYPHISIWSGLLATVFFGFAVQGIFISTYQYLIDAYEVYAASALVSCTFVRYLAAGVMQVVSIPMYENLGVHWTLTLLGCLATLMTPVPYVFYVHGDTIRTKMSKKAAEEKGRR